MGVGVISCALWWSGRTLKSLVAKTEARSAISAFWLGYRTLSPISTLAT